MESWLRRTDAPPGGMVQHTYLHLDEHEYWSASVGHDRAGCTWWAEVGGDLHVQPIDPDDPDDPREGHDYRGWHPLYGVKVSGFATMRDAKTWAEDTVYGPCNETNPIVKFLTLTEKHRDEVRLLQALEAAHPAAAERLQDERRQLHERHRKTEHDFTVSLARAGGLPPSTVGYRITTTYGTTKDAA
jgi:hypothetical protein